MPLPLDNPSALDRSPAAVVAAHRRLDAPAPLRLWHLTSLDAPTVAVVWTLAFAWAAHVTLPAWVPALVALATWSVYIADRLLDARNDLRKGHLRRLRERHFFHHRHRRILGPLAVAAAGISVWLVATRMPPAALERNSILAAAAAVYFSGVHTRRKLPRLLAPFVSKELLVGVLFTAACVLPAVSRLPAGAPVWPLGTAALYFAALAWLNCRSIERWETGEEHSRESAASVVVIFAGLLLVAVLFRIEVRLTALVAAGTLGALGLALLNKARNRITPLALRAAADLVLLCPAALLCR